MTRCGKITITMQLNDKLLAAIQKYQNGNYAESERISSEILQIDPLNSKALNLLGMSLYERGLPDEGIVFVKKATEVNPEYHAAHNNLGTIYRETKQFDIALYCMTQAIALNPVSSDYYLNRASVLLEIGDYEKSLDSFEKALSFNPEMLEAYVGCGDVFVQLKRYDEAIVAYDKALVLKPDLAEAWLGRANIFANLKQYDSALAVYDKSLVLKPDLAGCWLGRGNIFAELRQYDNALAAYNKSLTLKPDLAGSWLGQGNVFLELKRYEEALSAFEKSLALKSGYAGAWLGRGNVFSEIKQFDEAFLAYDNAFALKPDLVSAEGARLRAKLRLCDWSNFDAECEHLIASIRSGNLNAEPFGILSIRSSAADQLQCARLFVAEKHTLAQTPSRQRERYDHDRIRIAYLSADFHQHAMSFLMAGMFECHDRSRFDVTAISFGHADNSEMSRRLKESFERFVEVETYSDDQIGDLVRELEIDIAVDQMGFTANSRTGIFAQRPAPIQINYLGYPGTMGAQFIDYIIADRIVIPEKQHDFYSEKIVCLPNSYQVNDSKRAIADKAFTRIELGLPPLGFVFCCFNNNYKITPHTFDCWMRILKQVEGSVLWLFEDNATAASNLRDEAETRGVNGERLIFAKRLPVSEHLARHRLADLFLDTLPYNAHTTASDALWAGVPVLTLLGETFAGRVAASLLNALQLPELITDTREAYEALAIELATQPDKVAQIKRKLADNRLSMPLFDTKLFTKHIEAAYTAIHERNRAGLAPDHIYVSSS